MTINLPPLVGFMAFGCKPSQRATSRSRAASLHILDHFANTFDRRLDLDDVPRYLHVVGLRTDGVGLARHFLRQELELAARALGQVERAGKLLQMTAQPHDFFRDIAALGKDTDFANQVARLER